MAVLGNTIDFSAHVNAGDRLIVLADLMEISSGQLWLVLLTLLYCVRVATHFLYTTRRVKGRSVGGRLSVALLVLIFIIAMSSAVISISSASPVTAVSGLLLVAGAVMMRWAALARLRSLYSETIILHEGYPIVSTGVYQYLRHPLHLSLILEILGLAILSRSVVLTIIFLVVTTWTVITRNLDEEAHLIRALGQEYLEYRRGSAWDVIDLLPGHRQ